MVTLGLPPLASHLHTLVSAHGGPGARGWLERSTAAGGPFDRSALLGAFTTAARVLSKAGLTVTAEESAKLAALGIDWPVSAWGVDEWGRVTLLLLASTHLSDAELEQVVTDCYRHGDNRERQAVLRALPLLPEAERFLAIAVDACRSHIQPVFEAIACENPYPAAYFPELNFNQMVLKALFTGVALERMFGLGGRLTPELARMANDYASERRAAGRSVPADIWRVTG